MQKREMFPAARVPVGAHLQTHHSSTEEEFLNGLPEEALVASQGCANPLVFAELKEGDVVPDLGSGGGIDAFLAAKIVGDKGKVYGLDTTVTTCSPSLMKTRKRPASRTWSSSRAILKKSLCPDRRLLT